MIAYILHLIQQVKHNLYTSKDNFPCHYFILKLLHNYMNKTEDELFHHNQDNLLLRSFGVGDFLCYPHKEVMLWTAAYIDNKYFLSTPEKYQQLVQIQRQIQAEKQMVRILDEEDEEKPSSLKNFNPKESHELSTITEIHDRKVRIKRVRVQEELQRQQQKYALRLREVRMAKKEEKKHRNLITVQKKESDQLTQHKRMEKDAQDQNLEQRSAKIRKIGDSNREEMHENIFADALQSQRKELQSQTKQLHEEPQPKKYQRPIVIQQAQQSKEMLLQTSQRAGNSFFYKMHSKIDQLEKNISGLKQQKWETQKEGQSKITQKEEQRKMRYKEGQRKMTVRSGSGEGQGNGLRLVESQTMMNTKLMIRDLNKQLREIGLVNPSPEESFSSEKQLEPIPLVQKQEREVLFREKQEEKANISEIISKQNGIKGAQMLSKQAVSFLDSNSVLQEMVTEMREVKLAEFAESRVQKGEAANFLKNKKLLMMPCIVNYQIHQSNLHHEQKENMDIIHNQINLEEKERLHEQITILKQVVGELRVQKLKYQVRQKPEDQAKTIHKESPSSFTQFKPFVSQRASGSIFQNFDESAVSQFKVNNLTSFVGKMSPGKIVKNISREKVAVPQAQQIRKDLKNAVKIHNKNAVIDENEGEASQNKSSQQVSKLINNDQVREQASKDRQQQRVFVKHKEGGLSQNKSGGIQLLSVYEMKMVESNTKGYDMPNNKQSNFYKSNVKANFQELLGLQLQKNQSLMQSSMPKPLNKHNIMNPPKFIIHQHRNHQKLHEEKTKKKLLSNFEELQKVQRESAVSNPKDKIQSKRRGSQQGFMRVIESNSEVHARDHPHNIKSSHVSNLKKKIYEIQISNSAKNSLQKKALPNRNTPVAESKSTKNFRLRVDASGKSSRMSHSSNHSSKSNDFKAKRIQNNIYVPGDNQIDQHSNQTPKSTHSHNSYREKSSEAIKGPTQKVNSKQQKGPQSGFKELKGPQNVQQSQTKKNPSYQVKFQSFSSNLQTKSAKIEKIQKKVLSFSKTEIPILPEPPKENINTAQMLQLINKIGIALKMDLQLGQMQKIIMKKYKNCIMLDIPNANLLKLVWHYSGKFYIGEWNEETMLKSGVGTQIIVDKHYYRGQFAQGKRNGSGIMISGNGNIYEGQWVEGEKSGRGKYIDKALKISYEGEWREGKRQGYGYLCIENQSLYQGTFLLNYKHGFGTQHYQNGDSYKGEYAKGRFHGKGIFLWASGSCYQGEFFEGCKNGEGKWCSANGEEYDGQYFYDKKHGQGRYKWQNGCIYEGHFEYDKQNGRGMLVYGNGREVRGVWKEGKIEEISDELGLLKQQPLTPIKGRSIESTTTWRAVLESNAQSP